MVVAINEQRAVSRILAIALKALGLAVIAPSMGNWIFIFNPFSFPKHRPGVWEGQNQMTPGTLSGFLDRLGSVQRAR